MADRSASRQRVDAFGGRTHLVALAAAAGLLSTPISGQAASQPSCVVVLDRIGDAHQVYGVGATGQPTPVPSDGTLDIRKTAARIAAGRLSIVTEIVATPTAEDNNGFGRRYEAQFDSGAEHWVASAYFDTDNVGRFLLYRTNGFGGATLAHPDPAVRGQINQRTKAVEISFPAAYVKVGPNRALSGWYGQTYRVPYAQGTELPQRVDLARGDGQISGPSNCRAAQKTDTTD